MPFQDIMFTLAAPLTALQSLALLAATTLLFLLPGLLLLTALYPRGALPWFTRVAAGLTLSISIVSILGMLVLTARLPMPYFLALVFLLELGLFVAALRRRRRDRAVAPAEAPPDRDRASPLLLVPFLVVSALALILFLLPTPHVDGDFWSYLAWTRKWATWGPRPFVDAYIGAPGFSLRYRLAGWLLSQSLLSLLTTISPLDLAQWWVPFICRVGAFLVVFALAHALLGRRNGAMLAALAQLGVWLSSLNDAFSQATILFYRIGEDKFLALIVLVPAAMLFLVRYLQERRAADFTCLMISSAGLAIIHPLGLAGEGLLFGSLGVMWLISRPRWETLQRLALVAVPLVMLLAIPVAQSTNRDLVFEMDAQAGDPGSGETYQGRILVLDATSNRYIVAPSLLSSPLVLAGLLLTGVALFRLRRDVAARYLLAAVGGLLLLLFWGRLTPLLGRALAATRLWRLVYLLPSGLAIGAALDWGMRALQRLLPSSRNRLAGLLPLALLTTLLGASAAGGYLSLPVIAQSSDRTPEIDLLANANRIIKEPSVIMAPEGELAALYTPGIVQQGFVPIWRNRVRWGIEGAQRDVQYYYEAPLTDAHSLGVLGQFGCDYVIASKLSFSRLLLPSPFLEPVYANSAYVLFKVKPVAPDHPLLVGNSLLAEGRPSEAIAAYQQSPAESRLLAGLRIAQALNMAGRTPEAVGSLRELTMRHQDSPWPWLFLAAFDLLQGKAEQSQLDCSTALASSFGEPRFPAEEQVACEWLQDKAQLSALARDQELARIGVAIEEGGELNISQAQRLCIGWYQNGAVGNRARASVEHVETISVDPGAYPPDWTAISASMDRQLGSTWLVGLWPESPKRGNRTPEEYAKIYHEAYQRIKDEDPSAKLAPGGIMEVTPLRLAWLDQVCAAYAKLYGAKLPADAWQINLFLLPEVSPDDWPAGIAGGIGASYTVADHLKMAFFSQQIVAFRKWMAAQGERDKPLLISDLGPWLSLDAIGEGDPALGVDRIATFLRSAVTYLGTAEDETLGLPADENRLVQRWAWHTLLAPPGGATQAEGVSGALFARDADGKLAGMTPVGKAFADVLCKPR